MVERQFTAKIKCLQTNWGGEYHKLFPLLHELGINFRHPCPHVHQQQGREERKHRSIVEIGLTLLAQASMDLKFWWEAFVSATYLLNRLPTSTLNNLSPFESLHGRKPYYKFLRVFGCACFPYLQPYNRHKLAFKTSKCLFLRYSPFHKGYRCLHPSGRVYIARSVAFDETTFPYQSLFALTPTVPHLKSYGAPGFVISSLPSSTTLASSTIETSNLSHLLLKLHQELFQSHQNNPLIAIPGQSICHMQTRSKYGVFKPKLYTASIHSEPVSVSLALTNPCLKKAMEEEYNALVRNNTWDLVPHIDASRIV